MAQIITNPPPLARALAAKKPGFAPDQIAGQDGGAENRPQRMQPHEPTPQARRWTPPAFRPKVTRLSSMALAMDFRHQTIWGSIRNLTECAASPADKNGRRLTR